jgi:KH domain
VFAPVSVLSYIIGKKGANLRSLQDNSGAIIQIPKRSDSETTSVAADDDNNTTSEQPEDNLVEITIEGIDAAVAKAKDELNKIIDEKVQTPPNHIFGITIDDLDV